MQIKKNLAYIPYELQKCKYILSELSEEVTSEGVSVGFLSSLLGAYFDQVYEHPEPPYRLGDVLSGSFGYGVFIRYANNDDHPYPESRLLIEWMEDGETFQGYFSEQDVRAVAVG